MAEDASMADTAAASVAASAAASEPRNVPENVIVYFADNTPAVYVYLAGMETYADMRANLIEQHGIVMEGKCIVTDQDESQITRQQAHE